MSDIALFIQKITFPDVQTVAGWYLIAALGVSGWGCWLWWLSAKHHFSTTPARYMLVSGLCGIIVAALPPSRVQMVLLIVWPLCLFLCNIWWIFSMKFAKRSGTSKATSASPKVAPRKL